jgi:hypothetical protein
MEKATNVMLPAFAMEVNPCMWERGHDAKVGAEMKAVAPKVRAAIERRTSSKLVMDVTVVNKEDATQVEVFLECILENQVVEIIYLHGATPLQAGGMFEKLLHVLQKPTVWSINLGELNFSAPQLRALQAALAQSNVTHMFYECMNGSQLKADLSNAVRENRRKHSLWKYSDDDDATPLQAGGIFEKLLLVLQKPTVWSINLGELNFSALQLEALQTALAQSNVTHMFYECMKTAVS